MNRRAFSLIEGLIAVLVLGVGLLGLAAVFPVVITQQRDAVDVIQGMALRRAHHRARLGVVRTRRRRRVQSPARDTTRRARPVPSRMPAIRARTPEVAGYPLARGHAPREKVDAGGLDSA